jgi:uncharacterized membrane protein YjfL (UPF0719 family)
MKKILTVLALTTPLHAQEAGWHAKTIGEAVGHSAIFGLVAVAMLLIGFKIFDKAVTHIDLEKEIQKGNIAAAILGAAVLIALAILLSAAIS